MQTPTPDMSSERLEPLGLFHLAALRRGSAAVAALAERFAPALEALTTAAAARRAAAAALIDPRVALRFAERDAESELRALFAAAEGTDRGRGGAVAAAIFPNGLVAEVRPEAAGQVEALRRVSNRLGTSALAEPLRAEYLPRLTQASLELEAAIAARKAATDAYGLAFAAELAAREDFCRAYDASAGALRQLFPRDRDSQELFFDTYRPGRRRGEGDPPE